MALLLRAAAGTYSLEVRRLASFPVAYRGKPNYVRGRRPKLITAAPGQESAAMAEAIKESSRARSKPAKPSKEKASKKGTGKSTLPSYLAFAATTAPRELATEAAKARPPGAQRKARAASPKAAAAAAATAAATTAVANAAAAKAAAAEEAAEAAAAERAAEKAAAAEAAARAKREATYMNAKRPDGLFWYSNSEELFKAHPDAGAYVAKPYEYTREGRLRDARRYSAFQSYQDYRNFIDEHRYRGSYQGLHEVIPEQAPRCLYFDLDGLPHWRDLHGTLVGWLRTYLLDFFGAERLGWPKEALSPVVLRSGDPSKYSAHVLFPEVQFDNYLHQMEYISPLLGGLGAVVVDYGQDDPCAPLKLIVDRAPYMRFQHFRGPFACKLKDSKWRPESSLDVEGGVYFREDPLTCFAGYTNPDYALPLAPVQELIDNNEELHFQLELAGRSRGDFGTNTEMDMALFDHEFMTSRTDELDLFGIPEVEQYEVGLQWLHRTRSSQWASWFRLCGVCCTMLGRHGQTPELRQRILRAHMAWSQGYAHFDVDENLQQIEKAKNKRVSGLPLLRRLLIHDNPYMKIRM